MAFQRRFALASTAFWLAGCTTFTFDGTWLGVCETPDLGMRVQVTVLGTEEDEDLWVSALVHRPDRRGAALSLDCRTVEHSFFEVEVSRCTGDWEGTGTPHDFDLSGEMEPADLGPVLRGDCTLEGLTGDLELWQLP